MYCCLATHGGPVRYPHRLLCSPTKKFASNHRRAPFAASLQAACTTHTMRRMWHSKLLSRPTQQYIETSFHVLLFGNVRRTSALPPSAALLTNQKIRFKSQVRSFCCVTSSSLHNAYNAPHVAFQTPLTSYTTIYRDFPPCIVVWQRTADQCVPFAALLQTACTMHTMRRMWHSTLLSRPTQHYMETSLHVLLFSNVRRTSALPPSASLLTPAKKFALVAALVCQLQSHV